MENKEIILCPVCGEENPVDSKFCLSCGVTLASESSTQSIEIEKTDAAEEKVTAEPTGQNKNKSKKEKLQTENTSASVKTLSTEKLFYIIFALLLMGSFIAISAGLFDQPKVVAGSVPQANTADNFHSGVDLNSLNEINRLEDVVKSNPNDLNSLLHLGHLLNDSGLKDRAIEKYKSYLDKDPKNADVWVDMGVCYFELGNNAQAISAMETALKYQPRHQIANLNLGIVNVTAGNTEKAKKYWKTAVEINPSNEIGRKAEELLKSH